MKVRLPGKFDSTLAVLFDIMPIRKLRGILVEQGAAHDFIAFMPQGIIDEVFSQFALPCGIELVVYKVAILVAHL